MRISLRLIAILWLGLFIIIGALLFNAYSKFKPESFIALLTEQVQENYPNSKLTVGNISYRFSMDFNLNLQNITLIRENRLIGSIGEFELKVPWWLLLINRGNAQINLKDLDIFVDHHPVKSTNGAKNLFPKKDRIRISLPEYLLDTRYTLRALQVSVRDIETGRRYFNVSKLLVREFQYGKNSAFELNIPISITHRNSQYTSDLWLFGDLTPQASEWYLNYRGEFRTKENNDRFQIEDLVIGGKATFFPKSLKVDSEINLSIDKRPVGFGHLSVDQEILDLDLNITSLPLNYFGFINEEINNPYLVNYQAESEGVIKFKKMFNSSIAKVTGKLSFDGDFQLSEKDSIPGKWQVGLMDSRWELSFMSPKGDTSFFRRSVVDKEKNNVTQFIEEIGFSGLDLSVTIAPLLPLYKFATETSSSYFTTTINFKKCLLGDQVLDGNFKYGVTPEQKFYLGEILNEKGQLKLNFEDKNNQKQVEIKFKNFIWDSSFKFLSPIYSASQGLLNGNVQGRWTNNWESGQWLVQIKGNEIIDTNGLIPDFITHTLDIFDLEGNPFKKQMLNISGADGSFFLNSLVLENSDVLKINGKLNSKNKSYLTLSHTKNKKTKTIKKDVPEPYWIKKDES